jgi:predicted O-linked N-acetylglucosamine transferase (SPINDLY family)
VAKVVRKSRPASTDVTIQQAFELGLQHHQAGRLAEAEAIYRQILAAEPRHADSLHLLGVIGGQVGRMDVAIELTRQAIALAPGIPAYHYNLAEAHRVAGQFDQAIAVYRQAIALKPKFPEARSGLSIALRFTGRLDEAIAVCHQNIASNPESAEANSDLILALNYHPGWNARAIAGEQQRWNVEHGEPLRQFIRPHSNDRTPDRRLRIGYVSGDFREHPVGYNMLPLLARHDHDHFEAFCYAEAARPDGLTDRFRSTAHRWRSSVGLSDEQLAAQIREDRIDILVDLALHTAKNRLLVFARKPAPVQVTFAGYPGSTGLTAIDYRLSDPYLDPPGIDESIYSEKTVRLPHSFWCYDPLDCGDLPVNNLPAQSNGYITFGCLNNFCKVNDPVLRLWASVLRAVPSSRLILLAPDGSHRQHTLELLREEGIAFERIEFVSQQPRRKYLELYHRLDLGLDTLPYNGHTTSLDSFWMGVPVVTLVGQTIVGRAGLSQLTNLNLPELIASTLEQHVQIATDLAGDLPRLASLRRTLRHRMETSPLMDAPRFARDVEAAFRSMWRSWCAQPAPLLLP